MKIARETQKRQGIDRAKGDVQLTEEETQPQRWRKGHNEMLIGDIQLGDDTVNVGRACTDKGIEVVPLTGKRHEHLT